MTQYEKDIYLVIDSNKELLPVISNRLVDVLFCILEEIKDAETPLSNNIPIDALEEYFTQHDEYTLETKDSINYTIYKRKVLLNSNYSNERW